MNISGPSFEHWGTPVFISLKEERCWIISTNWNILLKKHEASSNFPLPGQSNTVIFKRISLSSVSKSLEKYKKKTVSQTLFWLTASHDLSKKSVKSSDVFMLTYQKNFAKLGRVVIGL